MRMNTIGRPPRRNQGKWRRSAVAAALLLALATPASAGPGGLLDPGFGTGGVALLGADSDGTVATAQALAFQSTGSIVTVGGVGPSPSKWVVRRYLPGGTRDTAFGTSGRTVLFGAVNTDTAWDVLVGPDDRIYVGGLVSRNVGTAKKPKYDWNYAVARLLADGLLDTTWGTGGTRVILLTGGVTNTLRVRLAMQEDGKVLVVGPKATDLGVTRLTTAGNVDTTYAGGSGTATVPITGGAGVVVGAALDATGRLLLATQRSTPRASFLLRLTSGGGVDATFPLRDLLVDFPGYASSQVHGLAAQSDGSPVLSWLAASGRPGLVRYTPAGVADAAFGVGGLTTVAPAGGGMPRDLVIQADGRIVLGALVTPDGIASHTAVTLFRFESGGALDTGYGVGGMAQPVGNPGPGTTSMTVQDVALAADGRVLALSSVGAAATPGRSLIAYLSN